MELAVFPKQTTSSLPFTSAKNIALLYFFFGRFLNHFFMYTFSSNSTTFWCNSDTAYSSASTSNHSQRVSKILPSLYWLVFLLLVLEYDFVVTQCWNCPCAIGGNMFQRQKSLSNLTKLKIRVVTVLPCPLYFLQDAGIKFHEILCRNICRNRFYPDVAHLLSKVACRTSNIFHSSLASFWIIPNKRAFLADHLLLLSDRSCDLIVEYTSFWYLWWILIEIAYPCSLLPLVIQIVPTSHHT